MPERPAPLVLPKASRAPDRMVAGQRDDASVPAPVTLPRSGTLRNAKLFDPMPGGGIGGWGGDTGLDIIGDHLDIFAVAAGTLDYSEWGHTRWTTGKDTAFSVRLALDEPIPWKDKLITHVYYTHMSAVDVNQVEGAKEKRHVQGGEHLGVSGVGNGTPHLHLGLLLNREVEQDSWEFILREGEVRSVLGGYKNGETFPRSDRPKGPGSWLPATKTR